MSRDHRTNSLCQCFLCKTDLYMLSDRRATERQLHWNVWCSPKFNIKRCVRLFRQRFKEQVCCFTVHHSLLNSLIIHWMWLFTWCFFLHLITKFETRSAQNNLKKKKKKKSEPQMGWKLFCLMPSDEIVVSARRWGELCCVFKIPPSPTPSFIDVGTGEQFLHLCPLLKGSWAECLWWLLYG